MVEIKVFFAWKQLSVSYALAVWENLEILSLFFQHMFLVHYARDAMAEIRTKM